MADADPAPDTGRLAVFVGVLVVLAAAVVVVARLMDVSVVTLAPVYMFTPMAAGLAVCFGRNVSLASVGVSAPRTRWFVAAAVGALPLVGLALAVAVAVPGVAFDPSVDPVPGLPLPGGVLGVVATFGLVLGLGVTVNALFAFGEEFGWRGYLLWELAPLGFWRASALVGIVWGLWHAPIIAAGYNFPSFPLVGVGVMTAACLAFSPVYTSAVVRAESVFAAAVLHGVFNGSAGIVVAYAAADDTTLTELVASPVGLAGIVAFGLAAAGIALAGTPALSRGFADSERGQKPTERAAVGGD